MLSASMAVQSAVMPTLWITISGTTSRRDIKNPLTVGSSPANAVVFEDPEAARQSFKLDRDGVGWYLRNISERDNVCVNGTPSTRRYLEDGDEICVGDDTVVFHTDEPPHMVLRAFDDGVFPVDFSELPSAGPWTERRIIKHAFALRRARKIWRSLTTLFILAALAYLGYAIWLARNTDPLGQYRAAEELAQRALSSAENRVYLEALDYAGMALRLPITPQTRVALEAGLAQWPGLHLQIQEQVAQTISSPEQLLLDFPETQAALRALHSAMQIDSEKGLRRIREAAEKWAQVSALADRMRIDRSWLRVAYELRSFEVAYSDSPQAAMAARLAKHAVREWRNYTSRYYELNNPPSRLSLDFGAANAPGWEVENGEWAFSSFGLELEAVELPPAVIFCPGVEYCAVSYWVRADVKLPEGATAWCGLNRDEENFIGVRLSRTGCVVEWKAAGIGGSEKLELAPGSAMSFEMAVYEDQLFLLTPAGVAHLSVPGASGIFGNPAFTADTPGTVLRSMCVGR